MSLRKQKHLVKKASFLLTDRRLHRFSLFKASTSHRISNSAFKSEEKKHTHTSQEGEVIQNKKGGQSSMFLELQIKFLFEGKLSERNRRKIIF